MSYQPSRRSQLDPETGSNKFGTPLHQVLLVMMAIIGILGLGTVLSKYPGDVHLQLGAEGIQLEIRSSQSRHK